MKRQATLTFIFITLLLDVIGFGIIIPILPKLIVNMIHGSLSEASVYSGWLMFAFSSMQFVFSPVMGNLSDRYGRRPVLLLSLFGFGLDYLFLAFAPSIGWLFLGRVIAGIMGASYTTATAYIADISTPEKRAQNFGMVGAAFGLGFIIGPVVGGLLGKFGTQVPFLVAAGLTFLNCLYGYFVLPESLKPENRRPFDWRRANPIGSFQQVRRYPIIFGSIGAFIFIHIAAHATQSTWTFFTMERLQWNETWVGYSLGFVGILFALVQAGLIRVTDPILGQKKSVYIGFLFYAVGFTMLAFASTTWMAFVFLIPYALGGISEPAIQGIMANQVPDNEQGELQGLMTSIISATSIVGPPLMSYLFFMFTEKDAPVYFPGMPFIAGAVLTLLSLVLVRKSLASYVEPVPTSPTRVEEADVHKG